MERDGISLMRLDVFEYLKSISKSKKKKQNLFIVLISIFLIFYFAVYTSPKVYLKSDIKAVTEKDFKMFYENNDDIPIEKKTRDNCRLFSIDLQIKKPFIFVRNINIYRESLDKYLEYKISVNKAVEKFKELGSYYATDNAYHTIESIDVYLNRITDEKIYDFFGDYRIKISWVDFFNRKHKGYYYLKDHYQ